MSDPIPAPAPGIHPFPEAEVDPDLRPFLRPLGDSDERFIRHNLARNGAHSPLALQDAMRQQQRYRAEEARKAEAYVAPVRAAVDRRCPVCLSPATPLSRYQYRDMTTELCGLCKEVELAQRVAAHAARKVDGASIAERATAYRQAQDVRRARGGGA